MGTQMGAVRLNILVMSRNGMIHLARNQGSGRSGMGGSWRSEMAQTAPVGAPGVPGFAPLVSSQKPQHPVIADNRKKRKLEPTHFDFAALRSRCPDLSGLLGFSLS
jgi:hypothetical protein